MMDVKVLVLFVAARLKTPATIQEIYELCYQDEKLTYFDVCDAVPKLVASGHLETAEEEDRYVITALGREHGSLTEESVAFTVRERAKRAVERFNRETGRSKFVKTDMAPGENGDYTARLQLDDDQGRLMTLELMAPSQARAAEICRALYRNPEKIYNLLLEDLLEEDDFGEM